MAKNPFDADKLLAAFSECKKYTGDVPMEPFCQGMEQLRRIVLTLGSAFSIASNDITEKLETLGKRQADLKNSGRPMQPAVLGDDGLPYDTANARNTVQYMVEWEMERKVTATVTSKYISASRSILRLLWFMDFLQVLIGHLLNPTPAFPQLKNMAQDAYDKALAPHHPWVVRQTIAAAMYFCPTEEAFWKRIVAETDPHRELDEVKKALGAFLVEMAPVREKLWNFFKMHKLEGLP